MSIQLICGLPGHGKGCLAVDRILRDIKLGHKVYCNFPLYASPDGSKKLHPSVEFFQTWEDIRHAENGKIYLDEAPRWFSSRAYAKNTPEDLEFFAQHRHNGLGLILICQSPQQLDVEIRDRLAAYVWYIKRLWGPDPETDGPSKIEGLIGWNALVRKFVASDFRNAKRFALRSYNMNLQQFHPWYDTDWIVGGRNGEGTGLGKTQRGETLAAPGAAPSPVVQLLDGRTLTKEQYLAGMVQQDRGESWRWTAPVEAVEDTLFRKVVPDGEAARSGGDMGFERGAGGRRGSSDAPEDHAGSSPVGGTHRTVFKLVR